MGASSWPPQRAWNVLFLALHFAAFSLQLYSGRQSAGAAAGPSGVGREGFAHPGRRLQAARSTFRTATGTAGGASSASSTSEELSIAAAAARAPTERLDPAPASALLGGGRQGGARPAAATAAAGGPTELPIDHLADDPGYTPGSGQLADPLSCLWVDPETGVLNIKCRVTVEPAPFAATAPPPPKYDPTGPALLVRASSGSSGLAVVGDGSGGKPVLAAYADPAAQAPLLQVQDSAVQLAPTRVFHSISPGVGGAALFVEGLPGKSIISAVQDQQDEGACFFVRDRMTAAGQVVVSADVGPATPATGASLTVVGKLGVPAMRVRATPLNLDPALAVLPENTVATAPLAIYANRAKGVVSPTLEVNGVPDVYSIAVRSWTSSAGRHSLDILNDEVTLGPTFISGALHPESSYVLQLAYPAPGQTLLEAYGSSLEAADLALNADGVLTARRLNSGPLTVSASSGEAALQVLGSATVNGSLAVGTLGTTGPATFGGNVAIGSNMRGQQRSLTVSGKLRATSLNVKLDALFEGSVEVWRSITARWYFWWRQHRKHIPFAAPAEPKPTASRKL